MGSLLEFRCPPAHSFVSMMREQSADVSFHSAVEMMEAGSHREALRCFRRSLTLNPGNAEVMVNIGTILQGLNKRKGAEVWYRRALEFDPGYALAHYDLATVLDVDGCPADQEEASLHYLAAINLSPSYADAHYNLALLLVSMREWKRAIRHFRSYLGCERQTPDTLPYRTSAAREIKRLAQLDLHMVWDRDRSVRRLAG